MRPLSGTATSTVGPSVGRTRARKLCIGTTMSIGGMAGRAYDAASNPKLSFNDHMERDDRVGAEAVDRFLIGGPERRRVVIAAPDPAWTARYDVNRLYERVKRQLATHDWAETNDDAEAKTDVITAITSRAEAWATATGWTP